MTPVNEYSMESEDLALRRKYAEMLRAQSMQPPQSAGMAGRTVAPIHWTQALSGLLRGASGDVGGTPATSGAPPSRGAGSSRSGRSAGSVRRR